MRPALFVQRSVMALLSLLLACACLAGQVAPKRVVIHLPKDGLSSSGHLSYITTVLKRALELSKAPSETIDLVPAKEEFTQARLIAELMRSPQMDIIWTMTSKEREQLMLPIRIPLLKGLLGHRVFLIRQQRQPEFSAITELGQLARFTAGQGSHWPDTDILRANGLPVDTSPHYELLFTMLKGGRFDYFPRGINEIWPELEVHAGEGLAVETDLMLAYPAPMYFFVKQGNQALAERLRVGLKRLIDSGEMDQLFYNHPSIKEALEHAAINHRRVFTLTNPDLPEATPLDKPEYWISCCAP